MPPSEGVMVMWWENILEEQHGSERINAIKARTDAASPGENGRGWVMTWNMKTGCKIWAARDNPIIQMVGGIKNSKRNEDGSLPQWWKDAEFVQSAREDIPWLLSYIDIQKAAFEALQRENGVLQDHIKELVAERDALARRLNAKGE